MEGFGGNEVGDGYCVLFGYPQCVWEGSNNVGFFTSFYYEILLVHGLRSVVEIVTVGRRIGQVGETILHVQRNFGDRFAAGQTKVVKSLEILRVCLVQQGEEQNSLGDGRVLLSE